MKIAMLGHKRIPSREGGVEIVVEELASRMVAKGHAVTVYNRSGHHVSGKENDHSVKMQKEYRGIQMKNVKTPQNKSLNAVVYSFFATLKAVMGRFDVIHFHAEGPCSMIWIPKLFGIKTVATIHGLDWQRAKWGGFATKFLLFGEKMAANYADEIIVLSKNVQEYFAQKYKRQTTYIPNGISIPEQHQPKIIKEKYGLEKDSYLLFLARIVPEKGLHYLLEAFREVETDIKLLIVGGSSHSDDYLHQIREQAELDKRVIMTGFIQGRELEELYANCILYVLPSDIEGMPISLLEALSYGKTCLVSDIAENQEVIGEHGQTFQKANVKDLQEKLEQLLVKQTSISLENKKTIEDKIKSYVRQTFSWEETVSGTLELYEKSNRLKGENLPK